MSAYNKFRGEYCGHSSYLLTRILRDEWDFRGFVTSDWMHGVRDGVAGFKAGMDVEMPAKRRYGRPLREGLKRGLLTEEEVNERVHRILRTRLWFALAPDPQPYEQSMCAAPSHIELARRVAEESMVLLRNEGDLLPLHAEKTKHIGVFGRLATVENTGDRGSSAVRAPYVVTPLEGIEARMTREGGVVSYRETFDSEQDRNWVQSLDAAILIVGLSHLDEGEWFVLNPDQKENAYRPSFFGGGGDRTRLSLHDADESLIRGIADVQPNTIVVCVAGSVVTMPWREKVSSIVFGFYSGMEGGHALANLLFGTVNPSGKLPFTIPESETHLPPFEPFAEQAHYGRYHGYRLYDTQRLPVAFPFGYGLSYTRFTVGNLVVEKTDEDWIVRVDVSNVGEMRGAEVLQVYLSFPDASVEQPDRKLVAFQKVWLEPKAKRSVALRIERAERGHFDVEQMDWIFPDESVIVWVGTSSRDEVASYTVDKKNPQVQNPRAE